MFCGARPFRTRFVAIVRMFCFSLDEGEILARDARASSRVVTGLIFPASTSLRADSRRVISWIVALSRLKKWRNAFSKVSIVDGDARVLRVGRS